MEFHLTFNILVPTIAKLFVLMLAGYLTYKIGMIDDKAVNVLSQLLVKVFLPALIIYKTVSSFSFSEYPRWWGLPLCSILFSALGMLIGWVFFRFSGANRRLFREFISSCGFQNSGYLPMNLVLFAFAGAIREKMLIYIFLYILGFNVLIWSVMPVFLSKKERNMPGIKSFFNAPVVATIIALLWVFFVGKGTLPGVISDPLSQLGQMSFPVAMITLGAYLCRHGFCDPDNKRLLALSMAVKLVISPIIVLVFLYFLNMNAILTGSVTFFLFLESIMPSAVSLVVIGGYAGSDNKFLSNVIFYSHIISIISIPLWLGIFGSVMK